MRNPPWIRDELILALNLYLKHRSAPPGKDSEKVIELSQFLNKMGQVTGPSQEGTFRNANGVYMKMMNFRRFDPLYTKDGKKGLSRGNKDEEFVWADFASEPERLNKACSAIRKIVDEHADDNNLVMQDEPEICDAPEGRILTRVHRVRERDRNLVKQAKKLALKKHGRLFCEACNFDFAKTYGPRGEGLIDVHHSKPLHTLAENSLTKVEDLVLLCANCHRVVHSSRKWLSVAEVAALVRAQ